VRAEDQLKASWIMSWRTNWIEDELKHNELERDQERNQERELECVLEEAGPEQECKLDRELKYIISHPGQGCQWDPELSSIRNDV